MATFRKRIGRWQYHVRLTGRKNQSATPERSYNLGRLRRTPAGGADSSGESPSRSCKVTSPATRVDVTIGKHVAHQDTGRSRVPYSCAFPSNRHGFSPSGRMPNSVVVESRRNIVRAPRSRKQRSSPGLIRIHKSKCTRTKVTPIIPSSGAFRVAAVRHSPVLSDVPADA